MRQHTINENDAGCFPSFQENIGNIPSFWGMIDWDATSINEISKTWLEGLGSPDGIRTR